MKKSLPRHLTSYDLFKTLAVALMIVDHIGYYFYPEELWWRVFGRMCVPIWFFLIGYAQSRDMGPKLWIGGLILLAGNVIAGMSLAPLNILFSMLAVRWALDPVMEPSLRNEGMIWRVTVIMFFLIVPTMFATEYGTQGLLLAMFGYLMRHTEDERITNKLRGQYFVAAFFMFVITEAIFFGMNETQFMVMGTGVMAVMGALYFFQPAEFPRLTKIMTPPVAALLRLTGRRTLEVYVAHLLLFKFMGAITQPERFVWFDWKLFSQTGV
jgi:hypothetical protein